MHTSSRACAHVKQMAFLTPLLIAKVPLKSEKKSNFGKGPPPVVKVVNLRDIFALYNVTVKFELSI